MSVRIGHASMSENSSANGVKGDQTGKEVQIINWYPDSWSHMFIHPNPDVREKHAKAVEAGCLNDKIGYGQSDRNTLYQEAAKVGMNLSKIDTIVNTDCSAFQHVCAVASGAPGVSYGSNGWTTRTMIVALKNAGYKMITNNMYLRSANYCVRGAIIIRPGHTICALDNGPRYKDTLSVAYVTPDSPPTIVSPQSGPSTDIMIKVGDIISFTGTSHYTSAFTPNGRTCKPGRAKVSRIVPDSPHPYHIIAIPTGGSTVHGWVNKSDVTSIPGYPPYVVIVESKKLDIRSAPFINSNIVGNCPPGVYTIIKESTDNGAKKWGKLKSGVGWIPLDRVKRK